MKSGREEITLVKVPVYALFDIHVYPLFYSCVFATSKINSFYIVCNEVFSLFLSIYERRIYKSLNALQLLLSNSSLFNCFSISVNHM